MHELSPSTTTGGYVSKNETHLFRYIAGGMALGLIGTLMAAMIPDVRRYRRMRAM